MQIILNQSEVEAAVQAYVDDQINLAGDINIVINADGTASVGINEEVHEDTPPVGVEKKTRRSRKNPQEAKHRPVEPEPEEVVEEVKVEETQTSTGGQNESSTPEPEEEAVSEPEAQEEVVQEEAKAEEPAEKPATKPSLFAGLKRS
ncbi:hypothetical protein EpBp4_0035 [Escherichia phage Bp4]|uniref:Uncharacterized protein n=3 Tax=Gamaleyavirus TaxID=1920753 RepID=X2KRY0_9CAUD|nr:hypothetical protein ECBP1_0054 [Escherichia phage ECBP1]YP_009032001.1 hypothetical protein EpBp4_0035 [Escherichia phage Bp4]AFR52005.1 hypothetical protein ECBP1_0054 [Escherichia phage ECBP1]AHN83387.1 hypothetical protein EpBp4_0035 [Escherichia phage Bp4]AXY81337.1 hypothetical protein [Escherichia phage PD38]